MTEKLSKVCKNLLNIVKEKINRTKPTAYLKLDVYNKMRIFTNIYREKHAINTTTNATIKIIKLRIKEYIFGGY